MGLFDANILEITQIVHDAGGLCYYDGANLNAIMGIVRPGDTGFDVVHLNLHKTFSSPHGQPGPGAAPRAAPRNWPSFSPCPRWSLTALNTTWTTTALTPIGKLRKFYGVPAVVRAGPTA